MKYLFYDSEFATSKGGNYRICEIGYVLTDEFFNVIKRANLIINPDIKREEWDWIVVKNILTRKVSEYEKSLKFNCFYEEIKELINDSDYIFGHSLNQDILALNKECIRYNLLPINFTFYDIKVIYKEIYNCKNDVSLVNMLESLSVTGETRLHDGETDAFNTMIALKQILINNKLSIGELINLYPDAKDITNDFTIDSLNKKKKFKSIFPKTIKKNTIYRRFLKLNKPKSKSNGVFKGKRIYLTINYQDDKLIENLKLVKLIVKNGGRVTTNENKCDIIVVTNNRKKRKIALKQDLTNLEGIDKIYLLDLLNILNISKSDLIKMETPSIEKVCNL